jgi:hypothetical protein
MGLKIFFWFSFLFLFRPPIPPFFGLFIYFIKKYKKEGGES